MEIETLVRYLDAPAEAADWLSSLGISDTERAHRNLLAMVSAGLTLDLFVNLCGQLETELPRVSDPDMALNNLERFVVAARNPLALGSLLERDLEALPILLQIFSISQYLSDLLERDPESFDLLRITDGTPVARQVLVDELCAEVEAATDERQAMSILRRFKHRETLRIAYGDLIRRQHVDTVTRQISYLADAMCEAALRFANRKCAQQRGEPVRPDGKPARFVALALGKLGGAELNYSSDIDLIFLCDDAGATSGPKPLSAAEYFHRLQRLFVKLLSENTEDGAAYRVDLRLRPNGRQGQPVIGVSAALQYYDVVGRTWERQAFVKARPIAGDLDLGREFLEQLEPWIYRSYLQRADITGIKALKRRIEKRAEQQGGDERNVKTGRGGIRDIEFVIQFLQLLNGGDLAEVRTGNTLEAIARLEKAGCLTHEERTILEENYCLLRRIEHRLQIMFDLQTHTLPEDSKELRRLAIRSGYSDRAGNGDALAAFREDLRQKTSLNRAILDHLLHDTFGDEAEAPPETDLVLDPDPPQALIEQCLGGHRFQDVPAAYKNLMALANEPISFLSTRRCRHFLASIAPQLLAAIANTPDPDATLVNLSRVSDSLGGKGVLWELFSVSPASLQLYVRLCASSPYLSSILTSNPGMVDALMDSLMIDELPSRQQLEQQLRELCWKAEDLEPILHSFKDAEHLRVGVRDVLGKQDVRTTHQTLSDIAEVLLNQITAREYEALAARYGEPRIGEGSAEGQVCEFIILALGKLGGREPNYHSDLDVVFLYQGEGHTALPARGRGETTTNQHFFSQLAQRIIKVVTRIGPQGRLYEMDARLRPTGKSGALAVSLRELERYFREGEGQLWERQAMCKARAVYGSPRARSEAMQVVRQAILQRPWEEANREEIRVMRMRLEETASKRNLKRGPGGTVDVEFTVQMLQLKHALDAPSVLTPGTLDALAALSHQSKLASDDAAFFTRSYRLLRSVESGLRLMNTTARHDLPEDEHELTKLAFLLGYENSQTLERLCAESREGNRERFARLFG